MMYYMSETARYCCCCHQFEFCHYEKILELWFVIQGTVLDLKLLQHDLWILQRTAKGHELFHANLERYSLSSEVILFLLLQNKVYFVVLVCIFDFKTKSRELGNLYIFFIISHFIAVGFGLAAREQDIHLCRLQEKFVAEQLLQGSGHEWDDLLFAVNPFAGVSVVISFVTFCFTCILSEALMSSLLCQFRFCYWLPASILIHNLWDSYQGAKLADVYLRRLLQPGVRQRAALQHALHLRNRPLSASDLASISLDGLRNHIVSAVESQV
jgi:hypothetical protein